MPRDASSSYLRQNVTSLVSLLDNHLLVSVRNQSAVGKETAFCK